MKVRVCKNERYVWSGASGDTCAIATPLKREFYGISITIDRVGGCLCYRSVPCHAPLSL